MLGLIDNAKLQNFSPAIRAPLHKQQNMPRYDSDSSDDGEDYTETNVLLGYASKEPTGDSISHLGGQPVRFQRSCSTVHRADTSNIDMAR